jgi:hypothetical protein
LGLTVFLAGSTRDRRQGARLSIDMPASLHRRFKLACVATDKLMVEEVLTFIKRRTAELEKGEGE